ncbi:hypothetical protein [Nocardia sp. NBC_01388]|uniref:hypothetical protein n=1 Tax=Nocardia sp. NBC_01388 TaxID=2903596 RepID=UPI0032542D8B
MTKSPLFIATAVAGFTLYPFLVEPSGDHFVAVWYPANFDIATTVFDRPIPWFVALFYGAGIPLASVAAYEVAKRGLPARYLLWFVAAVTVLEIPVEMLASHLHWMNYYGNHATVLGEPIYCFAQNGGMFAVVALVLAWLIPRIHGWRWVLVPFATAAVLPVYALVATFPSYIAIASGAGPAVSWSMAALSTVLNAAVVVACVYSPTLQRLRTPASSDIPSTAPMTPVRNG